MRLRRDEPVAVAVDAGEVRRRLRHYDWQVGARTDLSRTAPTPVRCAGDTRFLTDAELALEVARIEEELARVGWLDAARRFHEGLERARARWTVR